MAKQDPTWRELFALMASKKDATNVRYVACDNSVVEIAQAMLRREPTLADVDPDIFAIIIRKFHRTAVNDYRAAQNRIQRLRKLSELATQRFNHPPVNFDEIPLARRLSFEEMETRQVVAVPSSDQIPDGFDRHLLGMSLDQVLTEYIRERLVGKSPETSRLMRVAIKSYSKWLGRTATLGDLRQSIVLDYVNAAINRDTLSRASIQTHLERLLAMWRFAARKRWLPDYPDIRPIHVPDRTPDSWSDDELVAILEAIRKTEGYFDEIPRKLFWEALLSVIYDTGERIGAVIKVRFDDIREGWLTVRAELRKGKTRDKSYKLRPSTIELVNQIQKLNKSGKPVIFHWPLSKTYLWRLYSEVLASAGVSTNRRSKFHKIRRTTASNFEAAGGNATDLLDHNSRATTKKSYLDPRRISSLQPADIVPAIGDNGISFDNVKVNIGNDDLLKKLQSIIAEVTK